MVGFLFWKKRAYRMKSMGSEFRIFPPGGFYRTSISSLRQVRIVPLSSTLQVALLITSVTFPSVAVLAPGGLAFTREPRKISLPCLSFASTIGLLSFCILSYGFWRTAKELKNLLPTKSRRRLILLVRDLCVYREPKTGLCERANKVHHQLIWLFR